MCAKTVNYFDISYFVLRISTILIFLCQNELSYYYYSEVIMNVFYDENKNDRFIGFFFK